MLCPSHAACRRGVIGWKICASNFFERSCEIHSQIGQLRSLGTDGAPHVAVE